MITIQITKANGKMQSRKYKDFGKCRNAVRGFIDNGHKVEITSGTTMKELIPPTVYFDGEKWTREQ